MILGYIIITTVILICISAAFFSSAVFFNVGTIGGKFLSFLSSLVFASCAYLLITYPFTSLVTNVSVKGDYTTYTYTNYFHTKFDSTTVHSDRIISGKIIQCDRVRGGDRVVIELDDGHYIEEYNLNNNNAMRVKVKKTYWPTIRYEVL